MEGYRWTRISNWSLRPGTGRFWGLLNPDVCRLIDEDKFDSVVIYTGYAYATFWFALAAAKWKRVPIIFGTDAHDLAPTLAPLSTKRWKTWVKKRLWPWLFGLADVVIVPSSGSSGLMRSLGIPDDRVVLTPYCVDNDWWSEESAKVDRRLIRSRWHIPSDAPVALFCGKFQPWKRPHDLLQAFARAGVPEAYLVYAGEGPLRAEVERQVHALGIDGRVRFLGFVNQSGLPAVYRASDVFVLPSDYEAFGVVVNEAMLCGCPVIASDRVGARFDLIRAGESGFIYPSRDVNGLAQILRLTLRDPVLRARISEAARKQMAGWSPDQNVDGTVRAIERAVQLRSRAETEWRS
ncbi:MAG: glycosyltransferase family 4 protein, partial [Acidobacteriota bacterium]|nr:glycosyltransferase family 4 protein [Acidobacteriota bacterium]